ncbi:hypothetical protein L195_g036229, partial [Trifolium pratense]
FQISLETPLSNLDRYQICIDRMTIYTPMVFSSRSETSPVRSTLQRYGGRSLNRS